jgi:hypothetical protein
MNTVKAVQKGALWLLLPSVAAWNEADPQQRVPRLPLRLIFFDSLGRVLLAALLIWFLSASSWAAAAIVAITLGVLAGMRLAITHFLVKRMGGS